MSNIETKFIEKKFIEKFRNRPDILCNYCLLKFAILITLTLIVSFLWLCVTIALSTEPSCTIQNFYVPALNKFINPITITNQSTDNIIFFDLELQNVMTHKGIHYDAVNLTFSYGTNTSMGIGSYTVAGFYQGKGKKARRRDVATVTGSVPWEEAAMRALSNGSTADFRVHLDTKVQFNNYLWYSAKKRMVVGGRVSVDDSGKKVEKKDIKLKSGAPSLPVGLSVVASLLVFFYLLN